MFKFNSISIMFWLLFLNAIFWGGILFPGGENDGIYFIDVGQGDSQLVTVGKNNFLIDGGKDSQVVSVLEKITPHFNKRINLIFVSHNESDHIGGVLEVLERYQVGCVVYNGFSDGFFDSLKEITGKKNVPLLALFLGDRVVFGDNSFDILWPEKKFGVGTDSPNDRSSVVKFKGMGLSALFTGDISKKVEKILNERFDLTADILKISHHGSNNSSSEDFLLSVNPSIAVLEVGKNSYGHPNQAVLDRLKVIGSDIFRTDIDGTIRINKSGNIIKVFSIK